jgi:VanZ family protein
MKLTQGFVKYWLPVIILMGVIFWMSTGTFSPEQTSHFIVPVLNSLFPWLPPQDVDWIHGLIRKSGHVTEYFVLGLLLFRAFRGDSSQTWCLRWALSALIGVALCAASDEFHQSFVASRTASPVDAGIDLIGGILSQIVIILGGGSAGHKARG